jgi:hypothetical protein
VDDFVSPGLLFPVSSRLTVNSSIDSNLLLTVNVQYRYRE